jgi:hypothetical protein
MKITNFFGDKKAHELSPCLTFVRKVANAHYIVAASLSSFELEIETQGQLKPSHSLTDTANQHINMSVLTLNGSQLTKFIKKILAKKNNFFRTRADGIDNSSRNYYPQGDYDCICEAAILLPISKKRRLLTSSWPSQIYEIDVIV